MSWWNAKYTNGDGDNEITFGSKYYERAKAVEKVCQAVIDKKVKTPDDVAVVVHGRWTEDGSLIITCSECKRGYNLIAKFTNYCPACGAKMDGGDSDATD